MLFNPSETGDTSLNGTSPPATEGFDFASFLLGAPNTGHIAAPTPEKFGDKAFAWYVQDNWKATRRLTIDYGLRYDFQTYIKERDGLMQNISISTPNPSAGSLPRGTIFEGYGPGRCNCQFAHDYPWALQPRLGMLTRSIPGLCFAPAAASPTPRRKTILALTSAPTSHSVPRFMGLLHLLWREVCRTT